MRLELAKRAGYARFLVHVGDLACRALCTNRGFCIGGDIADAAQFALSSGGVQHLRLEVTPRDTICARRHSGAAGELTFFAQAAFVVGGEDGSSADRAFLAYVIGRIAILTGNARQACAAAYVRVRPRTTRTALSLPNPRNKVRTNRCAILALVELRDTADIRKLARVAPPRALLLCCVAGRGGVAPSEAERALAVRAEARCAVSVLPG